MSGDPVRLLGAGGAEQLERELLLSVRDVGPPSGAQDEAWRALAAQIAAVAAVGAATSSSAAAAGKASAGALVSWAFSTKLAVVAVGSSLALSGGYWALRAAERPPTAAPRPVVAPPSPGISASPAPVAEAAAPEPLPEVVREEGAPGRKPEPPRRDSLQAESALLMQARAQLRSGNPGEAQASLDRLQAQFPKGMLAQEREVLAIEVLAARGNASGARQRARAFIKAFPKSPHSQKLARFVE